MATTTPAIVVGISDRGIRLQHGNGYYDAPPNTLVDVRGKKVQDKAVHMLDPVSIIHTGNSVQSLSWQYESKYELQPVGNLQIDNISKSLLEFKYSSCRIIPIDYNSFYLSLAVCIFEQLITPAISVDFRMRFQDVYGQARNAFNLSPEINACLSKFDDLNLRFNMGEIESKDCSTVISNCLNNEGYKKALIMVAKLLTAYSIWIDSAERKVGFVLDEDLNYEISNILYKESNVEEYHISYVACILQIELVVVATSIGFVSNSYSYGKYGSLHLLEYGGFYTPLMTRHHMLYLNNHLSAIEKHQKYIDSIYLIDNKDDKVQLGHATNQIDALKKQMKKLENSYKELDKENDYLKNTADIAVTILINHMEHISDFENLNLLSGQLKNVANFDSNKIRAIENEVKDKTCSYCYNFGPVIKLECSHFFCHNDIYNIIYTTTRGLMILNEFEIDSSLGKEAVCQICNLHFNNHEVIRVICGEEKYAEYKENANRRLKEQVVTKVTCKSCMSDLPEEQFFKQSAEEIEEEGEVCQDLCKECMIDQMRNGLKSCPHCDQPFKQSIRKFVEKLNLRCIGCNQQKGVAKHFTKKMCPSHDKLCIECMNMIIRSGGCFVCARAIMQDEIIEIRNMMFLRCKGCGNNYSKKEIINSKTCLCNRCIDCQKENAEQCVDCQEPLTEEVKKHVQMYLQDEKDRAQNTKKHCIICMDDHHISETRSFNCNHYYGEECLKMMLECYVQDNDLEKVRVCPANNCKTVINSAVLQSLLTPESFDKYSRFEINRQYKQVQCLKCGFLFEPWENRKIVCMNPECKFEFCKICNEPFHENGDCKEIFIQRKIEELEEIDRNLAEEERTGCSQCPGCRTPYIKDQGCEHVKCVNQECGIEFCFTCACIRSPTMEHGNHYHRPICKWYSPPPDQEKDPDMKKKLCTECNRLGEMCKPPKDLRVPRRIAPDEI